jgi:hypothetical protein
MLGEKLADAILKDYTMRASTEDPTTKDEL